MTSRLQKPGERPDHPAQDTASCVLGLSLGELLVFKMSQVQLSTFERPWRDKQLCEKHYVEREKTIAELANQWNCSNATISNWLDRHDIDTRRPHGRDKVNYACFLSFSSRDNAYEVWNDNDATSQVRVHRLLAVAEYGFDEVADKHIHHKNGIEWDNRPENIEPLEPGEHTALHHEQGDAHVPDNNDPYDKSNMIE